MSVEPVRLNAPASSWSAEQSAELYRVASWGDPYFSVSDAGNVTVHPVEDPALSIDLAAVVSELCKRGVQLPVLVRFQDILRMQVRRLNEAFADAIAESGYANEFRGVYPIKVNQLHEVVDEVLDAGRDFGLGLECGSKAELVAALANLPDDDTLLVCNGVKDQTMLSLIISAQQLGRNVLPVIERYFEYEAIKTLGWSKGFVPSLGVRIRLATSGSGRWAGSSGLNSKFGLSLPELMRLVDELEAGGLLDRMQLLHCHLGSQIADIAVLKQATKEVSQIYAALLKRGVALRYLDVGGGLGVNYDEGHVNSDAGINYSMQEYANAVVSTVKEVCDAQDVPVPTLVTESGRAITAHHSVLIVPVLAAHTRDELPVGDPVSDDAHESLKGLAAVLAALPDLAGTQELLEAFHDTKERQADIRSLFMLGYIGLDERALADRLFWAVCRQVLDRLEVEDSGSTPPEVGELETLLTDQYLCDFSVFQSMLDHWAIGQPFPIMPISRLSEQPSRRGVLVDITCDSDGKVSQYISALADNRFLPVHALNESERYFMGFFLMGAYEDIMGDAHNLFGRVSEAHVYADADEPQHFWVEKIIPGTAVQDMLAQVQYFPNDLQRRMSELVRAKIQAGVVRPSVGMEILDQYMACFQQSTYCGSTGGLEPDVI
jgi:arginine decarboxylase